MENLEEEKEIKIREREEKNGKSIFCQKEHGGEKYHKRARISSPEGRHKLAGKEILTETENEMKLKRNQWSPRKTAATLTDFSTRRKGKEKDEEQRRKAEKSRKKKECRKSRLETSYMQPKKIWRRKVMKTRMRKNIQKIKEETLGQGQDLQSTK